MNKVFGNFNHEYTSYLRRQKSGRLFLDEFPISCITNLCRLHLLYQEPGAETYAWSSSLWTQRSHHLLQHNSTLIEYLFGLQGIKIFKNKNQSLYIVLIFNFISVDAGTRLALALQFPVPGLLILFFIILNLILNNSYFFFSLLTVIPMIQMIYK